jgi:hypothetical protein
MDGELYESYLRVFTCIPVPVLPHGDEPCGSIFEVLAVFVCLLVAYLENF